MRSRARALTNIVSSHSAWGSSKRRMYTSIIVPDLDVAVVRSVPLIERFENVDLMLVEMKFQGNGHSAMISMLFDMNTHFWFQGHSKRHAISTVRPGTGDQLEPNSIRSEHTLSYGPERRRARCVQPPHLQILCRVARASDAGDRGGGLAPGPSGFLVLDISQTRHSRREAGACPSGW